MAEYIGGKVSWANQKYHQRQLLRNMVAHFVVWQCNEDLKKGVEAVFSHDLEHSSGLYVRCEWAFKVVFLCLQDAYVKMAPSFFEIDATCLKSPLLPIAWGKMPNI